MKAPSSTTPPSRASLCKAATKSGAGSRGCESSRSFSRPMPCTSGILGVIGRQLLQDAGGENPPAVGQQGEPGAAGLQQHQPGIGGQPLRLRGGQGMIPGEDREICREGRCGQQGQEGVGWIGDSQGGALRLPLGRPPAPGGRTQIEEPAAADRVLRRDVPDHEAIRHRGRDRPVEHELNICRAARFDRLVTEQDDPRADLGRGMMQPDREPLADPFGRSGAIRAAWHRSDPSAHAAPDRARDRRAGSLPWKCPGLPG